MKSRRSKLTLCPLANRHIGSKALQPSQFSARDQSQPASNRHRSKRAHPRLPWHSQCPLAGIGCGTECCAWLDAPRFAAKPQVQGRLAPAEEFGPSREYAPTARPIKPVISGKKACHRGEWWLLSPKSPAYRCAGRRDCAIRKYPLPTAPKR